jgi:hypothetical protein
MRRKRTVTNSNNNICSDNNPALTSFFAWTDAEVLKHKFTIESKKASTTSWLCSHGRLHVTELKNENKFVSNSASPFFSFLLRFNLFVSGCEYSEIFSRSSEMKQTLSSVEAAASSQLIPIEFLSLRSDEFFTMINGIMWWTPSSKFEVAHWRSGALVPADIFSRPADEATCITNLTISTWSLLMLRDIGWQIEKDDNEERQQKQIQDYLQNLDWNSKYFEWRWVSACASAWITTRLVSPFEHTSAKHFRGTEIPSCTSVTSLKADWIAALDAILQLAFSSLDFLSCGTSPNYFWKKEGQKWKNGKKKVRKDFWTNNQQHKCRLKIVSLFFFFFFCVSVLGVMKNKFVSQP